MRKKTATATTRTTKSPTRKNKCWSGLTYPQQKSPIFGENANGKNRSRFSFFRFRGRAEFSKYYMFLQKLTLWGGGLVFIPAGCPHRYGASEEAPWQIRWVHFSGRKSADYLARLGGELFGEILPGESEGIVTAFEQAQDVLREGYTDSGLLLLSANLSRLLALAESSGSTKLPLSKRRLAQSI